MGYTLSAACPACDDGLEDIGVGPHERMATCSTCDGTGRDDLGWCADGVSLGGLAGSYWAWEPRDALRLMGLVADRYALAATIIGLALSELGYAEQAVAA